MSDHSDFKTFLFNLQDLLDNVDSIMYTVRCRIRVEQRLNDHAESVKEEVSAPSETEAVGLTPNPRWRQCGPELPGTSKEKARSEEAAEKVAVKGGRMESKHGRS